jgi:hypothetical protein
MGNGHILTLQHDYLLMHVEHQLEDAEARQRLEAAWGHDILQACFQAHRAHERQPIHVGHGITHVDEVHKADLSVYVWYGYVLQRAPDTPLDLLRRAHTKLLVAILTQKNKQQWLRLMTFFNKAYPLNQNNRSDKAILKAYVAGRPRIARQLLLALEYLIEEQPGDQDLAEIFVVHLHCLFDPKRRRGLGYGKWVKKLHTTLQKLIATNLA